MTTKWIVTYPGITQDLTREFDTEESAKAFQQARRDRELHMWRHVRLEKIEVTRNLTPQHN
jgi:hypothetical protein